MGVNKGLIVLFKQQLLAILCGVVVFTFYS